MASSGKLGALVVIIAIVGTILGGTALGSEEVTRTSTDYTFVSDVSGLYKYTDQEIFVDYEPSSNLTGFHKYGLDYTSGITYDAASSLSNYPVKQQQTPSSGTLTLSASSTSRYILQCKLYPDQGDGTAAFYYTVNQPYVQSMSDALSSVIGSAYNLDRIEITAKSYTDFGPVILRASEITESPNNPSWTYSRWYPTFFNITSYIFENSTQIFKAVSSDGTVVWQANLDDVRVIWGGTVNNSTISPSSSTLSNSLSYKLYEKVTPIYLDPTKGVEVVAGSGTITWSNGYLNDQLSVYFLAKNDGKIHQTYIHIPTGAYSNSEYDAITVRVHENPDSGMGATLFKSKLTNTGGFETLTFLKYFEIPTTYDGLRIDIRCDDSSIDAIPVGPATGSNTPTFQYYTEYPSSGYTIDVKSEIGIDMSRISKLYFYTWNGNDVVGGNRFVVKDTKVFMDTYINVIYDQTFNIQNYFLNITYPRLDMKSFAIYGNTMTINNHEFTGLSDGYIDVVDSDGKSHSLLLDNVSIMLGMPDDSRVYMRFNNDDITIDLGQLQTKEIEFGGAWYMATDLYEGNKVTTTAYEFNPMQWAFSDNNVTIIFYLGLLALCSIIAARYSSMGWADIILVSCAGIVGFLLLV